MELLRRAIAIGDELVKISDSVKQPLASVHIATGLDILRAHAQLREKLELSRTADMPSAAPGHDA
jgi:hypothetical protein